MSTFQVDPEELRLVQRAVVLLSNEIGESVISSAVPCAAGSHQVTEETRRFVNDWSDARAKITRNLDAFAEAVQQARTAYDTVERDIVNAATPQANSQSRAKEHA